ncbi:hypothetical protein OPV22_007782 [Ensete ventricosum]|uniref:Uncharacterized protein n=1 Tax=Ensete ventricosum TaxID=4639 RepID=A0AAV8PMU7_ENSVE|nr:hypothetical protein OPV22_007782 [Ensete ventricosum]
MSGPRFCISLGFQTDVSLNSFTETKQYVGRISDMPRTQYLFLMTGQCRVQHLTESKKSGFNSENALRLRWFDDSFCTHVTPWYLSSP